MRGIEADIVGSKKELRNEKRKRHALDPLRTCKPQFRALFSVIY